VLAFGARDQSRGAQSEGAGAPQGGGNSKLMLLVASSAGKRASGATAPISNPKPKGCFYWCAFTIGIPHANCPHGEFRKAQNILYQINILLVNSVASSSVKSNYGEVVEQFKNLTEIIAT